MDEIHWAFVRGVVVSMDMDIVRPRIISMNSCKRKDSFEHTKRSNMHTCCKIITCEIYMEEYVSNIIVLYIIWFIDVTQCESTNMPIYAYIIYNRI